MCNNENIQRTGAVPTQAHNPIAWGGGTAGTQEFAVFSDAIFKSDNNITYTIKMEGILGSGGESYVYKAVDQVGNEYAAKIYVKQRTDRNAQAKRSKVYAKLKECQLNPAVDHLMPLCDYGIAEIQIDGQSKHTYPYFVDILPLIKEETYPSLATLTFGKPLSPKDMYEIYLPQLVIAIRTLHDKKLVHRDIKPENIIVMGKDANGKPIIALGDFGTAALLPESKKADEPIRTIQCRGTPGYTPSEVFMGAVLPASDMYSLGCTIGALLNGGYFFPKDVQTDARKICERLRECIEQLAWPTPSMKTIIERGDGSSELKRNLLHLFLGLVQEADTNRFTLDDVSNFCKMGENWDPPVNKEHIQQNVHTVSIRILGRDCHSTRDIAQVLEENLDLAKITLRQGMLSSQILHEYPVEAGALDTLCQQLQHREADDEDVARAIHILDPGVHICISGKRFENLPSLCNDAITNTSDAREHIFKLLKKKHFSWKYKELSNRETDEKTKEDYNKVVGDVQQIESLFSNELANAKQAAYYYLLYWLGSIDKLKAAHMIDEAYISSEEFDWEAYVKQEFFKKAKTCRTIITLHKSMPEKLAWLAYQGLSVKGIVDFLAQKDTANIITVFFKLLETQTPELSRSIYLHYGPYSFLTWIRQNIGLYCFPQKHDEQRNQWNRIKLDNTMKIDEMLKCFVEKLLPMYENLKKDFSNNLLAAYCGLAFSDINDPITSIHSQAFFTEKFMGFEVPNGFVMSLNKDLIENRRA